MRLGDKEFSSFFFFFFDGGPRRRRICIVIFLFIAGVHILLYRLGWVPKLYTDV